MVVCDMIDVSVSCDMTRVYETRLIHTCDMTHSCV